MKSAASCFRIARSFSLFQLRKTNALPILLALMACPLAHALPAAKFVGIEKTVSTAVTGPQAVAVDSNGVVYIADPANHQVLKRTPSGLGYTTSAIATGASYTNPVTPSGVAVDASFNVYIADSANNQVLLESWNGSAYAETVSMSGLAGPPTALAVDSARNIFILNNNGSNWQVVLAAYQAGTAYAPPLALTTVNGLLNPAGIAVDAGDDLFIADESNGQIWMATYGGGPIGDNYTVANLAQFMAGGDCSAIAIDAAGNLYILGGSGSGDPLYLETYVSPGVYTESEIASTTLLGSNGVAAGSNGHIYIADSGNNRVIEEVPGAAAAFGSVAIATASAPATMLFAFSGVQTNITASVLTQGAPGLDFADTLSGTCTSNGSGYTYDTTTAGNYKVGANLFCSVNVTLTPAFPGGRFGAVALQQAGSAIATGFANGSGAGPQVAFTNPAQVQVDGTVTTAQGMAADAAGNLYVLSGGGTIVVLEAAGGGSTLIPTTTLSSASGIAVDGAGNVYIADTGNDRIVEEALLTGSPTTGTYLESTISTGSSSAQGIAVDGSGNLYIADTAGNRVLKETLSNSSYSETIVSASLNSPAGVAVDGAGAVYIADTGHGQVKIDTPSLGAYNETALVGALTAPTGVAVDGGGNVFISDSGVVLMEPVTGGAPATLTSSAGTPVGVATDGVGDVFYVNGTIENLTMSVPTVLAAFGGVQVGSASAPQAFGIENIGNAPLAFSVPGGGAYPLLDADFSVTASGSTTCPVVHFGDTPTPLAPGSTCVYSLEFTPSAIGNPLATTIGVIDNTLNALNANQSISLSGIGLAETPMIAFNVANQTYGVAPITVAATSASAGAFTYALVSGPATVSGTTVTITGSGTVVLSATQAANGNYAAATQNATFTVATEVPTIAFNVANQTYGVAPIAVAATSASAGAFTYALVSGPATVSGTTVTITGSGTVVLSATQAANGSYATATQNATFTVATEVPTISFNVANQTYGVAPIAVAATSASAGAFTYALVSGPATVSGTAVTITGSGTVVLSATQAANGSYAAATQNATFTVAAEVPSFSFSVANQTYGVAPFTVGATSPSAGAFTFALVSGPATVSGATVTIAGSGTVVLSATQAANGSYTSATQIATFTVAAETPTIAFTVPNQTFGVAPIAVAATSASAGAFTYALVSGPASVSGSTVAITGSGTVVLSATQAANGSYATATQNATFTVAAETPTIAFTVPNQTFGVAPIAVAATSASAGAFTYALVSGPASVSGSTVAITGSGTVVLSATQAANGSYATGTQNATFTVAAETPTIAFTVPNQTFGVAPITVAATSASAGAFSYALVSGPASVSGSTVAITGSGTVVLSATQAANGSYTGATQNTSFTVAAETPAIAFTVPNQTFGVAPITVAATSPSAGAFSYALVSGPASVSGATVTIAGAGTVVLSATQAASGSYTAGTQNASFTVAAKAPTIAFTVPNQTFGVAPITVAATSASAGAFTYALVSGPATVSGSTVTVTGSGTVVLSATQAANGSYATGTQNAAFTVAVETPAIAFIVPNQTYGVAPFTVAAASPSAGTFAYALVSGPATVSGATVTVTGIGAVVLSATQAANGSYSNATQNAGFTVAPETSVLTFAPIASQNSDSVPFPVSATSASAGAVTYAIVSGPATIAGSTVTVTGVGTVVLSAIQAAAGNFAAAAATASFPVTAGFTLSANGGSGAGSATIVPGAAAAFVLSLAPGIGTTFPNAMTFTVAGLPTGATATFSPTMIAAGSAATSVTLTIQTVGSAASLDRKPFPSSPLAPGPSDAWSLALLLPLLGVKRVRGRLQRMDRLPAALAAAFVLLAAMAGLTGCGSSGPNYPPAQTYTVAVTVTDTVTGAHTSTNLTLTVQ